MVSEVPEEREAIRAEVRLDGSVRPKNKQGKTRLACLLLVINLEEVILRT